MNEETSKPNEWSSHVREQLENLLSQVAGMQEVASQAFAARQGFYEKLMLLDGATLTLLFTVIGGLSHSGTSKETLVRIGNQLFIGSWLFIVSIMLSLLHNHVNISYLIHMTNSIKRTSLHGSQAMLRMSMKSAGIENELAALPDADPEIQKALKKGTFTEKICIWTGLVAQALTILGYVALVSSLQTVIHALASGTP